MEGQLFTLLPPATPRWKSFLAGWTVQAVSFACLFIVGMQVHHNLAVNDQYRVTRLVTYEPLPLPEQAVLPSPRVQRLPRPQPQTEVQQPPKVEAPSPTAPAVEALVVTPQVKTQPVHKAPEPEVRAPQLKLESKMPAIPAAPPVQVIAVGTFATRSPLMASAKSGPVVETGGFGDSNGVPATGHGTSNINGKGDPNLPVGAGHGNGSGYGNGTGVVAQAGFGNLVASGPAAKIGGATKASTGTNAPVEITYKPKPDYTDEGRKQKINGEVRLQVLFSADGRVHVMRVLQGLGYGLDEQAVKAAEQIKFKPAMRQGQAVDSTALVHIIFELIS